MLAVEQYGCQISQVEATKNLKSPLTINQSLGHIYTAKCVKNKSKANTANTKIF